ncbi:MAG: TIGR04211 family SH3 domain-containing protein [Deltaproteobacteria bacterium]|nr:TIGR04211 family SH3 domain-containing protein [Deltaproteobacteria bacterium]
MKKSSIIVVMVIGFCLIALSGLAAVYVSDKLEVPLRTGPGPKYKIVSMLQSGQMVEVVSEEDGWSNVLSMEGSGKKEGWILSRYLMKREPWEMLVKDLETENVRLREILIPMEEELGKTKTRNADLAAALKERTDELETLKANYASLRKDASGFLELRTRFEKTRSDLVRIKGELARATEENKLLQSSHRNKWFLAGALVLLLGLLIGLIMGRREKKRPSTLYL